MLEVDWSWKGVHINISPSQKLLLWSRATSVCALLFMNVSSPSAPAMLPFQRPEQTNVYVKYPFKSWSGLSLKYKKNQKPNIPLIQSLRCQQVPTNRRGFAPKLLCMGLQGCTFAIPLCCWKNTPWKQVSCYGMVFQCIVTISMSDSCLAGCPKLTFWIQCEKLYLLWM